MIKFILFLAFFVSNYVYSSTVFDGEMRTLSYEDCESLPFLWKTTANVELKINKKCSNQNNHKIKFELRTKSKLILSFKSIRSYITEENFALFLINKNHCINLGIDLDKYEKSKRISEINITNMSNFSWTNYHMVGRILKKDGVTRNASPFRHACTKIHSRLPKL